MTYSVYGLIDPRDGEVFYVGYSKNLVQRLSKHRSVDWDCAACFRCKEIKDKGLSLEHTVMGEFEQISDAAQLETSLILSLPNLVNSRQNTLHIAVDPSSSKDFGAKVIGRIMDDGRIEILSVTHSKAQFNKAEYQRLYMADQREIKRRGLSVTVKQYREMLK